MEHLFANADSKWLCFSPFFPAFLFSFPLLTFPPSLPPPPSPIPSLLLLFQPSLSLSHFQELITALHGIILQYERQFQLAALRYTETEYLGGLTTSVTSTGWIHVQIDAPNEGQKEEEGVKPQRSPHSGSSPYANGLEGPATGT